MTAAPEMPYSPSRTTDAGHRSVPAPSAATSRAAPAPDVQVEERRESSATWRRYQVRTNVAACSRSAAVSVTGSPATRTRLNTGTAASPCSPST